MRCIDLWVFGCFDSTLLKLVAHGHNVDQMIFSWPLNFDFAFLIVISLL